MRNLDDNYLALKKCVLQDYPYPLLWEDELAFPIFQSVYTDLLQDHSELNNSYYSNEEGGIINLNYIDHYVLLSYRFARNLWQNEMGEYADAVYYSLRVRGGVDIYYRANIGRYFITAHALGTCLDAHAQYGDGFKVYNGCHIGPYSIVGKQPSEWEHPIFGNWVTMLAGSKVYGSSKIGNNVIISINTIIINDEVPDNCIVGGMSPNLYFQKLKVPNNSILKK